MGRRALRKIDPAIDLSWHLVPASELGLPTAEQIARGTPRARPAINLLELIETDENKTSIEIEVGSGKGMFLEKTAGTDSQRWLVGIEVATKYAHYAAARLAKKSIRNARVIHGDAKQIFAETLSSESVDAVHVYFPDPWWKKRHRERRVMSPDFLAEIQRVLKIGGRLHFWTDVQEYFDATLGLIRDVPGLLGPFDVAEPPIESNVENEAGYTTHFERRVRRQALPVYRAEFTKQLALDQQRFVDLLNSVHRFPTPVVIKVVGVSSPGFVEEVQRVIRHELRTADDLACSVRETPGGRHIAVTLEPPFERPEQVLAVYARVRDLPGVVMLL